MRASIDELKSFLIDSGLISSKNIEDAYSKSDRDENKFGEILINAGHISEDDWRRAKAYVLGIPYVDLKTEKVDSEVLHTIPEPVARKHNIVPFNKQDNKLEVAMLDPQDLEAINFIKKGVGLKILQRLTDAESIRNILLQYQKSLKAEFGDLIRADIGQLRSIEDIESMEGEELKEVAEDLPVVRVVETLLSHAIIQKASDIHIEPYEKELIIRYRIDGILHDAMILPKNAAPGIVARIKVLAGLRLDEKRLPQDGRFKMNKDSRKVSFRVSILPVYYGEKVVMRLLPESERGMSLEESGFHGEGLEMVHRAIKQTTGMLLVTGPTGSGKSTTLYTMLEMLNTPDVNISTIEDPIEYQVPRITQTQVKPDIGLTFAKGLRSLVRQDPDILMVGEIRDSETANLAVNAALTGHLVLSTLHTNSAAGAIPRLLDMGVKSFLLSSTVNLVIAQRLVRRLRTNKEAYVLSEVELDQLGKTVDLDRLLKALKSEEVIQKDDDWSTINFYRPVASDDHPDGYAGRVGIHEVMTVTESIRELMIKNASEEEIERQAKSEGMLTMIEDGIFQAVRGATTLEEVLRVISE